MWSPSFNLNCAGLNNNTLFRNHALLQFITADQSPATVLQITDIGGLAALLQQIALW
jgi:hypothetical protein